MKQIIFVTSNELKFKHAALTLEAFDIKLIREHMNLQEMQADSGEEIARYKAEQAFAKFKQPLVVNDDSWSIPGLNGFPGPYMKYMTDWLTPQDWLNLTQSLEDRRIILQQHAVYQDEHGQHYFYQEIEGLLLKEIRGEHYNKHLPITSFDGGKHSVAEREAGLAPSAKPTNTSAWHHFGEWFNQQ
jgi:XTP/dITP diphosphohydrolase